ncbi:MAG: hypothetical protein JXR36_00215 [Bacteroidales bacterium]|nr:hypothetical protein [Bacteroidales bacterium]
MKYKIKILIGVCIFLSNIQIANCQTYCIGDEFILHAESYISGDLQWQYSVDGINWFDYEGATTATYTLNLSSDVYLRLQITDIDCLPSYYTSEKHIILLAQPDNSNAGDDQIDIEGTSTILSASEPSEGTGFWSISSGTGGNVSDVYSHNSIFTGQAGETYVLRWLVYNDCGYTEDYVTISFAEESFSCGDLLIDSRDGKSYPTISIEDKCWMAANLNVGTQITGATNASDNSTIEKFCYSDNSANCDTYGGLYQWNEAMEYTTTQSTQGICPTGWHIPSDSEVKELEISIGMLPADADIENNWRGAAQGIGTAMKAGGSSGFNILMSGVRTSSGNFLYLEGNTTEFGYIWCSTEGLSNTNNAYRRCWTASNAGVGRYDSFNKFYSYSIRCVKD